MKILYLSRVNGEIEDFFYVSILTFGIMLFFITFAA